MPASRSWLQRARRALTRHVDRLQDTLTVVTERLRETVAQAVSNNLASALREEVHALFADREPGRAAPTHDQPSPYRPRPWGERDRFDREKDENDLPRANWSGDQARGWRDVQGELPQATTSPRARGRVLWNGALAVGCQTAAWWLRRQATRVPAWAALGIGVLATGAAFVAGIGLAESALTLLSLADALRSGVRGLALLS